VYNGVEIGTPGADSGVRERALHLGARAPAPDDHDEILRIGEELIATL
jgi:hypothetical protein